MRRASLLAVILATGCASSDWAKIESVPGGELYIPKVYAPLLPGSIYPDRKTPVPAKGRPAMVVVCPKTGDCRTKEILEQAAQRAMVVLVSRGADAALAAGPEVDPARTGTLIVSSASLRVLSSLSKKSLFLSPSPEPPAIPEGAILKLYSVRPSGGLPDQAFRDAVEWLAGELGAR